MKFTKTVIFTALVVFNIAAAQKVIAQTARQPLTSALLSIAQQEGLAAEYWCASQNHAAYIDCSRCVDAMCWDSGHNISDLLSDAARGQFEKDCANFGRTACDVMFYDFLNHRTAVAPGRAEVRP